MYVCTVADVFDNYLQYTNFADFDTCTVKLKVNAMQRSVSYNVSHYGSVL